MNTETLMRVDPSDFASKRIAIAALEGVARALDGHDSLGEAAWRDIDAPGADSVGFLIEGRVYIHVSRADSTHWVAGSIRLPEARDGDTTTTLLDAAVAHVRSHGGGHLECWVFGATDADDASFAAASLQRERELFEMRVGLPLAETPAWPPGTAVRAFEPGRDDADWVRVNNLAFAGHPDQGGWTVATLEERIAAAWFDPSLFLLAVDAEGLAGFNWCKIHQPASPDPALGEIYVIGVDPRTQGTGLGRALAIAGLDAMHDRAIEVGMLFVAADNPGALSLYRSLGFDVHRTDRAYACEITA